MDRLLSATSKLAVVSFVLLTAAFLIAPLCVLALMSFSDSRFLIFPPPQYSLRWYVAYFSDASWMSATLVSLTLATIVSIVSTAIGLCAAVAFGRSRFAGLGLLQATMMSPLFVPTIIMAVGLYSVYSIVKLNGTMIGLVIGHLVLAIPYSLVVIGTALSEFDQRLEQAAQGLGASPIRAFRHVRQSSKGCSHVRNHRRDRTGGKHAVLRSSLLRAGWTVAWKAQKADADSGRTSLLGIWRRVHSDDRRDALGYDGFSYLLGKLHAFDAYGDVRKRRQHILRAHRR